MINTVADARRFGSFVKFPPDGDRSWGPHASLTLSGLAPKDYFGTANGFSLAVAMIETREALAISTTSWPCRPSTRSSSDPRTCRSRFSGGAALNPASAEVATALDHALARARAAGKLAGVYAPTRSAGPS